MEHSYAATDNASSLLTAVMGPKTALMVVMKLVSCRLFSGMPTVQLTMHIHTYTMQLCTIQSVKDYNYYIMYMKFPHMQCIQVVVLPSFYVPLVSVSPPVMDTWSVLMAVMRSVAVGCPVHACMH